MLVRVYGLLQMAALAVSDGSEGHETRVANGNRHCLGNSKVGDTAAYCLAKGNGHVFTARG
jgi:hypothetical protein